jgi:hypothetical protein
VNSTSSENDAFGDVTLEGIMSGTSNTAICIDARKFLVDGSGKVCVGDEARTGLGARVSNCFAIGTLGAGTFATWITPA